MVSLRFVFERVNSTGYEMRETVLELLNSGKRKPRERVSKIKVRSSLSHISIKSDDSLVLDRVEFIRW